MGCASSKSPRAPTSPNPSSTDSRRLSLSDYGLTDGLEQRFGRRPSFKGRFHQLPRKVEDDYEIFDQILGDGVSGQVHLAKQKGATGANAQKFAIKACAPANFDNLRERDQLKNEVENMLSMDHPHIVRLYDVYECEDRLYLVMECLEGGELFDRVKELSSRQDDGQIANLVRQMLLALNYIHSHGIVHRDLKLENVVFEQTDNDHLKLIDFGFSETARATEAMNATLGTRSYIAPEVWDKHYTSQCDLWSLGVITYAVISGHMPFIGPDDVLVSKIRSGNFTMIPHRWSSVSPQAIDFVRSLLVVNPSMRLTAKQALEHDWIAKSGSEEVTCASIDLGVADAFRQFSSSPKLRRCCMEMMAWLLSKEDHAEVRALFMSMDKNGEGTLSLEEFAQAMKVAHIDDDEVKRVFAAMDSNHDMEVNYSDFLAAMVSSKLDLNEKYFVSTFRKFDTNGSGYIEVSNLREMLGESFEGSSAEDLIKEADALQDNRISYQEFVAYLTTPLAKSARCESACGPMSKHTHCKSIFDGLGVLRSVLVCS